MPPIFSRSQINERVIEWLEGHLRADINPMAELFMDLSLDSMAVIELGLFVEDQFLIDFPGVAWNTTVEDICNSVCKALADRGLLREE